MDPPIAGREALNAAVTRGLYVQDLVKVGAVVSHVVSLVPLVQNTCERKNDMRAALIPGGSHEGGAAKATASSVWPELPLDAWQDTRDTLHMWIQVAGKIRLGLMPLMNHWWQVPLYVSSKGLTTSRMPYGARGLELEFDFLRHVLDIRTTEGG